jgi:hypothetical protein
MSVRRLLLVALGLSGAGAVVGGVCATIAVALILGIRPPHDSVLRFDALPFLFGVAQFGAVVGAVAAPVLGFAVLRKVPLGRAVVVTALGTLIGAVIGEFLGPLNPYDADLTPGVVRGTLAGFVAAGLYLRVTTRHARTGGSVEEAA